MVSNIIVSKKRVENAYFEIVVNLPSAEFIKIITEYLQDCHNYRKWVPGQSLYKVYFQAEHDADDFEEWVQREYFIYKLTNGV